MSSKEIINVDTGSALDVVNEVGIFYENLENTMEQFNEDKNNLYDYWTSVEASNFKNEMEDVTTNFNNFNEHYKFFIDTVKEILELYDMEEKSILATIRSYQTS